MNSYFKCLKLISLLALSMISFSQATAMNEQKNKRKIDEISQDESLEKESKKIKKDILSELIEGYKQKETKNDSTNPTFWSIEMIKEKASYFREIFSGKLSEYQEMSDKYPKRHPPLKCLDKDYTPETYITECEKDLIAWEEILQNMISKKSNVIITPDITKETFIIKDEVSRIKFDELSKEGAVYAGYPYDFLRILPKERAPKFFMMVHKIAAMLEIEMPKLFLCRKEYGFYTSIARGIFLGDEYLELLNVSDSEIEISIRHECSHIKNQDLQKLREMKKIMYAFPSKTVTEIVSFIENSFERRANMDAFRTTANPYGEVLLSQKELDYYRRYEKLTLFSSEEKNTHPTFGERMLVALAFLEEQQQNDVSVEEGGFDKCQIM